MNTDPLSLHVGKAEAVEQLGERAGLGRVSGHDASVGATLTQVRAILPPLRNAQVGIRTVEELGGQWRPIQHANPRPLTPPMHTNGQPDCFGSAGNHVAFSPDYKILAISNGYIGHFFGASLVFAADGGSIVQDVSSRYGELFQYYDFDVPSVLAEAPFIDGLVIPISDDIRPLNFCHWLIDWLPRLAFLGFWAHRPTAYVVTTPLVASFQRDSLRMCGFDDSRIIALGDFRAVRGRELLVPSDLRVVPHPIQKAAPWALSYLRSTVGLASIMEAGAAGRKREKIYVSRADAARRKVTNDAELAAALTPLGYRMVTLSDLSLAEQVTTFSYASHIVGLHGAGLSNLAFAMPGTKVIEIFPQRYGTPAFYVVAAGVECPYATYIADRTLPAGHAQFDDVMVDVPHFMDICSGLL